ncbi:DUF2798 domain-containing protein [Pseudomonas oryzihabitans]|uniref:DUF2798 domain-containing protein n=1 Tax=Pseudomonas oryzihabitans TaxID=47885 RepID=UPI001D53716D|nr:DUF2798 domain-containing protein [Pseudomonas oryzihabitans]HJE69030.1 DUF2798 domain-containing protein [Pseudomonas oryzihabitans]
MHQRLADEFPDSALSARRRLPKGVTPYVFALYMSTIMALLMCLVITLAEFGFDAHYFRNVMNAYQVAMPAAFVCVLLVRPLVARLVALTVQA